MFTLHCWINRWKPCACVDCSKQSQYEHLSKLIFLKPADDLCSDICFKQCNKSKSQSFHSAAWGFKFILFFWNAAWVQLVMSSSHQGKQCAHSWFPMLNLNKWPSSPNNAVSSSSIIFLPASLLLSTVGALASLSIPAVLQNIIILFFFFFFKV